MNIWQCFKIPQIRHTLFKRCILCEPWIKKKAIKLNWQIQTRINDYARLISDYYKFCIIFWRKKKEPQVHFLWPLTAYCTCRSQQKLTTDNACQVSTWSTKIQQFVLSDSLFCTVRTTSQCAYVFDNVLSSYYKATVPQNTQQYRTYLVH